VRGVRVVFEFDQPGHMGAMCRAYPSLCPTPACSPAYGYDVLDPSSADTLPAMQAVVSTLAGLAVDSVLHLGGDEVGVGTAVA
jgi:N-acetyl-beta-hexosaminidase